MAPSTTSSESRPSDRPTPFIQLHDVHLTLSSAAGAVQILRGIDLTVHEGESLGVVGPSGSGKSTMVMIIAGLERATRGTVRVGEADFTRMDEDALALFRRHNIGIVFQSFHLVPAMTALENVAIPLELAGRADAFARARIELEAVGLGHRLHHYPAQLSGGEQQRVALARAFGPAPKLILADEPTGNLDGATGRQVIDLLFAAQARHGTTLVLITHDPELARQCQRTVHLADGRILGEDAEHAHGEAASATGPRAIRG
jgi:putative ABC transport system ATP-binding protein